MSRRVIVIGPESSATSSIVGTLKSRGCNVVVSDDVRHALLLLRIFAPDVLVSPRIPADDGLALLLSSSTRPLIVIADVDELGAMNLLRQGVARVIPDDAAVAVVGAVVDAPLANERAVPRALAQLGLLKATGTLTVGEPVFGEIVIDAGRVHSASANGMDRPAAVRALLALEGPQLVAFVPAEAMSLDIEVGPSLEAISVDEEDIETAGDIPRAPATGEELASLPKPTVLVVEDDPDLSRLYSALLKARGFVVDNAFDGVEGYEKASAKAYDVVLSDIMMPRESGWDLLARARNTARLRETKFILLSHHADMVTRLRSANSGADAYLQKSERADAVVSAVVNVITPRRDLAAIVAAGAERFEGNVALIGPQTLLRLMAAAALSGRLAIRAGGQRHLVSFQDGNVIDAQCSIGVNTLRHRDALRSLLLLDDGHFTFVAGKAPPTAPPTPLLALLNELCAELEGWLELSRSEALAQGKPLRLRDDLLETYMKTCPDAARIVVDQVAAGAPPRDLIMSGSVDPILVDSVVRDMFRKGVATPT
jgi:DNA-binding response OmpR family regulator